MTTQEQNIAIAEACGKSVCLHKSDKWEYRGPEGDSELYCPECKKYLYDMRYQSYTTDLNACHEMEKVLRDSDEKHYDEIMYYHRWNRYQNFLMKTHEGACATAPQRCEAFLRAMNLWKE